MQTFGHHVDVLQNNGCQQLRGEFSFDAVEVCSAYL